MFIFAFWVGQLQAIMDPALGLAAVFREPVLSWVAKSNECLAFLFCFVLFCFFLPEMLESCSAVGLDQECRATGSVGAGFRDRYIDLFSIRLAIF